MSGSITSAAGLPVAGAMVSLVCDGNAQGAQAVTLSDGSFHADGVGWYPDACVARIAAEGYAPQEVPIGPRCR